MPAPNATPDFPPRLMLELQPDGTIVAELYRNGSRQRTALTRGIEGIEARQLLAEVLRDRQAQATREAERKANADLARHRRVWQHSAETPGQGPSFANRVIGPRNSLTATAKAKADAPPSIFSRNAVPDLL